MGRLILRSVYVAPENLWSQSATWGGAVPGDAEDALVDSPMDVTQDMNPTAEVAEVEVVGILRFPTDADNTLICDNIYVNGGSLLTGVES